MGKATQRRERRLAKDLQSLCGRNPQRFQEVWDAHVTGWCEEIAMRGRQVRRGAPQTSLRSISAIRDKADRLLELIGPEAKHLVGARTRALLEHESAKAVAMASNTRLYLFDTDSVYRLMNTRPQGIKSVAP